MINGYLAIKTYVHINGGLCVNQLSEQMFNNQLIAHRVMLNAYIL